MDPVLADAVYERLMENITKSESDPQVRPYCQESAIPGGGAGMIMFAMLNGESFPAALALAGHCDHLADGGEVFFIEKNQTIDLQIEWPGYGGWGEKIITANYEEPKGITRAKLVKEVAKQLEKFIENKRNVAIDPAYANYRVGPGGIELRHIRITSLEQALHGSWQPRFICSGP